MGKKSRGQKADKKGPRYEKDKSGPQPQQPKPEQKKQLNVSKKIKQEL